MNFIWTPSLRHPHSSCHKAISQLTKNSVQELSTPVQWFGEHFPLTLWNEHVKLRSLYSQSLWDPTNKPSIRIVCMSQYQTYSHSSFLISCEILRMLKQQLQHFPIGLHQPAWCLVQWCRFQPVLLPWPLAAVDLPLHTHTHTHTHTQSQQRATTVLVLQMLSHTPFELPARHF